MSKKLIISLSIILIASITLISQGTGTPSTLRVRTDANNSLIVASATQVLPTTSGTFSTRVLRTDANGNLLVALTGVSPTFPITIPASTCAAPSLALSGNPTTGIAFISGGASVVICINGVPSHTFEATAHLFGGTTSSEAGFARSGIQMRAVLGDKSDFTDLRGLTVMGTVGYQLNVTNFAKATDPTAPVACTSPSIVNSNGTVAFRVNVGTGCGAVNTLSVTMPAANNSWNCQADNITVPANIRKTATTTTSITFTNFSITTGIALAFTDNSLIDILCLGR